MPRHTPDAVNLAKGLPRGYGNRGGRYIVCIHIIPVGERGFAWEIRDQYNKVSRDSFRDGIYAVFGTSAGAFKDASTNAAEIIDDAADDVER